MKDNKEIAKEINDFLSKRVNNPEFYNLLDWLESTKNIKLVRSKTKELVQLEAAHSENIINEECNCEAEILLTKQHSDWCPKY